MKNKKTPPVAQRITQGMKELEAVLKNGESLEKHFTVRTLEIPDPSEFGAKRIARLIESLNMSQAVFARLIGVSLKLVEAWLSGTRHPSLMARRLLKMIEKDPQAFLKAIYSEAA